MKILNIYFGAPILWDIAIALTGSTILHASLFLLISLPTERIFYQPILSDLINSGFVIAGFVLTLLTILITLKENSRNKDDSASKALGVFFMLKLYFDSIRHLRNAIICVVLLTIGITLYRVFNYQINAEFNAVIILFVVCMYGTSIGRTLLILSNIMNLQETEIDNNK